VDKEAEAVAGAAIAETSRNQTAKRAARILVDRNRGFVIPTAKQRRLLLVEFARRNLVVYGNAFDVVKLSKPVDLDHAADIERNIDRIVLCEIKSTSRKLPRTSGDTSLP